MSKTIERARASAEQLGDIPSQLAALETMSVGALAEKYRELYGEPTRSRNKAYLQKRLAWRIQELAEGGLSKSALERIAQLGDELPERWRMRQAQVQEQRQPQPLEEPRDPRLPPVGTTLRRIFNGATHEVTIGSDGFEYGGTRFKTLSAVAKHITGTPWNGYLFFGLKKPLADVREESVA